VRLSHVTTLAQQTDRQTNRHAQCRSVMLRSSLSISNCHRLHQLTQTDRQTDTSTVTDTTPTVWRDKWLSLHPHHKPFHLHLISSSSFPPGNFSTTLIVSTFQHFKPFAVFVLIYCPISMVLPCCPSPILMQFWVTSPHCLPVQPSAALSSVQWL